MRKTIFGIINWIYEKILSVPVRVKVIGIGLLPILILGFSLNYWITTGLSDWLSYILTDVRVEAAMAAGGRSVFLVTALGTIASVLFSLLLAHILTEPILMLREMAKQVATGSLNARAHIWAKDEIGELAMAINTMTDHLVSNQETLARKNRSLDAINQVALMASRPGDIHDILYGVLVNVVNVVHLKMGWIYLRDPEQEIYHLASWYGIEEEMASVYLGILNNAGCECQSYLADGEIENKAMVRVCSRLERLSRLNIAKKHVTIPLLARNQQFGLINLLCEEGEELTTEDMELLSSIGAQISEIVANAWLQIKLVEKEAARQALLESLVQVQEEERARLARELHDGAGQTLTSLLVRLKTLERKSTETELQRELANIQDAVSETIEQIRGLAYRLRPAALDEFGLVKALETLIFDMTHGMDLDADYTIDIRESKLTSEVEVVMYRIAQEALTNIIRHARARKVKLNLFVVDAGIKMSIEDDGVGFNPEEISRNDGEKHLGLISMRERAEILNGALEVYTAVGKGTKIEVFIPVQSLAEPNEV